jgi:predicted nucleic acid-binding protein
MNGLSRLIDDLSAAKERIIIPAPALSEFLVLAGDDGPQYLSESALQSHIYVQPFDQMAAIELAAMELLARKKGSKRHPLPSTTPWQKVKIDRQIVAISKVHQVKTIDSDDSDVRNIAEKVGIKTVSTWELNLPKSKTPLLDESGAPITI